MSTLTSDAAVEVWFQIEKDADGYPASRDSEGLLCLPLDAECTQCRIRSVPFYLKNVAYGDVVKTRENPSGYLEFAEVVKRGGSSVYRLLLHESAKARKDEYIKALLDFDVLLEHDGDLIAIAAPPDADSDALVEYILQGKATDAWGAQDGYIFDGTD
jgi:hypothetical protein